MLSNPRRCGALVLAAAVLAGCGGGGGGGDEASVPAQFAYDDSKALEVTVKPTSRGTNGVRVDDVSFSGPDNTRLKGFLATPSNTDVRPFSSRLMSSQLAITVPASDAATSPKTWG